LRPEQIAPGFLLGEVMKSAFRYGRKARGIDPLDATELEILERELTGWNRFNGLNAREYFRKADLPVYDNGQMSRFNSMSDDEKDELVDRFIRHREKKSGGPR
jgi:hypothetical protein